MKLKFRTIIPVKRFVIKQDMRKLEETGYGIRHIFPEVLSSLLAIIFLSKVNNIRL